MTSSFVRRFSVVASSTNFGSALVARSTLARPIARSPLAIGSFKRHYLADRWPRWPEKWVSYALASNENVLHDTPVDHFYLPHQLLATMTDTFHDMGLSWIGAMVTTTLVSRLFLLYPYYLLLKSTTALGFVAPELSRRVTQLVTAWRAKKVNPAAQKEFDFWLLSIRMMMLEHPLVRPIKLAVYPISLIVVLVSNVFSIRLLMRMNPSMDEGGALWFVNLTHTSMQDDPPLRLPLIVFGSSVLIQVVSYSGYKTLLSKLALGLNAVMIPFFLCCSPYMPMGVLAGYFAPSALFTALHIAVTGWLRKSNRLAPYYVKRYREVREAQRGGNYWKVNPLRAFDYVALEDGVPPPPRIRDDTKNA